MDINKYRQKIEQSVAKAETRRAKAAAPKRAGDLRRAVEDKKTSAKTRIEVLGRLTRAEGRDGVPKAALERLADPKESPVVRLAAMKLLQQKQFFSSVAAEWRPAFVDALRAAVDNRQLRSAALEVLSLFKDRPTQARLLEGIRKPKKALVPVHEALRLLSTDVHADVIDTARKLAKSPQIRRNKPAFVEAVRILAADPGSMGTLENVLANDANTVEARRVAATAISHLAAPAPAQRSPRAQKAVARALEPKAGAKPKGALATHLATLRRIRERSRWSCPAAVAAHEPQPPAPMRRFPFRF